MTDVRDIQVRPLLEQDVPQFRTLRQAALQQYPEAFGEDLNNFIASDNSNIQRRVLERAEHSVVLGAYGRDNQLQGIVGLFRQQGTKMSHRSTLWGLYVSPAYQKCGIAGKLLAACVSHARTWTGIEQIHLSVVSTNIKAKSLYDKLGFTSYGVDPAALRVDGQSHDEHLMVLKLV